MASRPPRGGHRLHPIGVIQHTLGVILRTLSVPSRTPHCRNAGCSVVASRVDRGGWCQGAGGCQMDLGAHPDPVVSAHSRPPRGGQSAPFCSLCAGACRILLAFCAGCHPPPELLFLPRRQTQTSITARFCSLLDTFWRTPGGNLLYF